jgi:endonuclease/exonuclease/phosphatase family metal-dependent hydrolase
MRIVTINIWSGLDYQGWLRSGRYETAAQWEARYRHLVDRLRALDADVIAINEANPVGPVMRRLAVDLGYDQLHWRGLSGLRLGPIGLPVNLDEGDGLLARRELNLQPVGRRRLTGGWIGRWGSVNVANATQLVCGRIAIDGRPIYLFNTHWTVAGSAAAYAAQETSRDGDAAALPAEKRHDAQAAHAEAASIRMIEASRTADAVHALLPPGAPAILCGDFNTVPETPELRVVEEAGFTDAFHHLNPDETGATWDGARNDIIRQIYDSMRHIPAQPARLDYVFVNAPLRPALTSARVALDRANDRPHPSDHFAVVCDLDPGRISR